MFSPHPTPSEADRFAAVRQEKQSYSLSSGPPMDPETRKNNSLRNNPPAAQTMNSNTQLGQIKAGLGQRHTEGSTIKYNSGSLSKHVSLGGPQTQPKMRFSHTVSSDDTADEKVRERAHCIRALGRVSSKILVREKNFNFKSGSLDRAAQLPTASRLHLGLESKQESQEDQITKDDDKTTRANEPDLTTVIHTYGKAHPVTYRRGPWSQHEDSWLINLIARNGTHNWVRISKEIGTRSPKQCRERYHQSLKPKLKHDPITPEEGELIEALVATMGKRWAEIARRVPGRSEGAIKSWWNGGQRRIVGHRRGRAHQ